MRGEGVVVVVEDSVAQLLCLLPLCSIYQGEKKKTSK